MKLAVSTTTVELEPINGNTKVKSTVQIVSLVGQGMIKGFSDGYNGSLDNLEQYFRSKET